MVFLASSFLCFEKPIVNGQPLVLSARLSPWYKRVVHLQTRRPLALFHRVSDGFELLTLAAVLNRSVVRWMGDLTNIKPIVFY